MSFEVFMQVWCLQKSKLWWKQGKTGEKSQKQSNSHHPISATVGNISITSWRSFHAYDMSFWSLGSQEYMASNGTWFGFETKKLWPFENDYAELNGNVAATPNFATVRYVFGVLPGAQIMHTIYHFESWEVRNPVLQTMHDLDLKRRSYSRFKTDGAECENFAPWNPKCEKSFPRCEIFFKVRKWPTIF